MKKVVSIGLLLVVIVAVATLTVPTASAKRPPSEPTCLCPDVFDPVFCTSDGQTYSLGREALMAIYPLHLVSRLAILALLVSMREVYVASAVSDNGLNFTGFRLNAPMLVDNLAYVA